MPQYDTLRDRKVAAFGKLERWLATHGKVTLEASKGGWIDVSVGDDLLATSADGLLIAIENTEKP